MVVVASDADYPALVYRAQALTGGRGAYAALECLGGDKTQHVADAVRQGGTVVLYGGMAGIVVQWNLAQQGFRMIDLKVRGGGVACGRVVTAQVTGFGMQHPDSDVEPSLPLGPASDDRRSIFCLRRCLTIQNEHGP